MAFRVPAKSQDKQYEPRYRMMQPSSRRDMRPESREKTLFVGNLDKRLTEKHLIQLFSQFGQLDRVQMIWHHHGELKGQPKGYAFIEFSTKEEASLALQQANGVQLGARSLLIRFAEEKTEDEIQVDYKTSSDRRRAEVGARASALGDDSSSSSRGARGGRGGFRGGRGGGGGRFDDMDRYAYVPAPIPSAGFDARLTASGSKMSVAIGKIRAIEDKIESIEEEQQFERREAARLFLDVQDLEKNRKQSGEEEVEATKRRRREEDKDAAGAEKR